VARRIVGLGFSNLGAIDLATDLWNDVLGTFTLSSGTYEIEAIGSDADGSPYVLPSLNASITGAYYRDGKFVDDRQFSNQHDESGTTQVEVPASIAVSSDAGDGDAQFQMMLTVCVQMEEGVYCGGPAAVGWSEALKLADSSSSTGRSCQEVTVSSASAEKAGLIVVVCTTGQG
jgi:hypothetical protein